MDKRGCMGQKVCPVGPAVSEWRPRRGGGVVEQDARRMRVELSGGTWGKYLMEGRIHFSLKKGEGGGKGGKRGTTPGGIKSSNLRKRIQKNGKGRRVRGGGCGTKKNLGVSTAYGFGERLLVAG